MRSRNACVILFLLMAAVVAACTDSSRPGAGKVQPTKSSAVTPTASSSGQSYRDVDSGWTLRYPADFLSERLPGRAAFSGELYVVRFYDERFRGVEPSGQVEVVLYSRDADDLDVWLDRHSATKTDADDAQIYFRGVMSVRSTELAGRGARAFTWNGDEVGAVYTVVAFLGDRVFRINYFCHGSYCPTITRIFDGVVASVEFHRS